MGAPSFEEWTNMTVAIVTGASRGLGRATAHALAGSGWTVIVDGRDATALRAASQGVPGLVVVPGDVTVRAHRAALAAAARDAGGLDLLVNNASHLGPSPQPPLAEYPPDQLSRVYETNVFAPLQLIQQVLPLLVEARGVVVNVSSDAAVESYERWGGYGSSKAALDQLTNILGAEHPDLRVYAVDPGDMRTQMHQEAFPGEDISDRPPPEDSVPGLLAVLRGHLPSGRYQARTLSPTPLGVA
jgi:NAD(P)-dependent dehydrogenase (short-subunit alcohol dehydrogenase family)